MKPPPKLTFRQKLWPPIEPVVLILLRDIILFFIVLAALLVVFVGIEGLKAFGMAQERLQSPLLSLTLRQAEPTSVSMFLAGRTTSLRNFAKLLKEGKQ